jgi:hypothetical protein
MNSFNKRIGNNRNLDVKHYTFLNLQPFPKLYMIISIIYIPLVMIYDSKWNTTYEESNYSKLGNGKLPLLNFYSSYTISPLLTNLVFCTNGLIGILISISCYFSAKNLFISNNSTISHSTHAQLILYLLITVFAFSLDFLIGISFLIPNYNKINSHLKFETGFLFSEFTFLTKIVFLIVSTILLTVIYNTNYENLSSNQTEKEKSVYNIWFNYSVIVSAYIFLVLAVYIFFKAFKQGFIYKNSNDNKSFILMISKVSDQFIAIFPYFLHILTGILIFLYSYFLKGCGMCMYQNKEQVLVKNNRKFEL